MTLALRAMRAAVEAPPHAGPVTDAIRTMRAAVPDFDADPDPDLRALRRALADRIESDLAVLDMLGGDADEREEEDECGSDDDSGELTLGWCENVGQLALGQNTEDGDATALENLGAGFVRSGQEDDEDSYDAEPSLCGLTVDKPSLGGDDREAGDDHGIADWGALGEQVARHIAVGGTPSYCWAQYS